MGDTTRNKHKIIINNIWIKGFDFGSKICKYLEQICFGKMCFTGGLKLIT